MTRNLGRYYEKPDRPRTIVFTPAAENIEPTARCLDYVQSRRYDYIGLVTGDFDEAQRMLDDGRADKVVVDQRADFPPELLRRYEIVAESTSRHEEHRRTRIIRPGGEG